ncbi:MAG: FMN-binding protein [Oscillospiraceae bacterium]
MYKDIIKPTLVLIIICVVVAGLLAVTYNVTGIGELGNGLSQDELSDYAPQTMPTATKLVFAKVSVENESLLGVYKDEGGAGVAIHIVTKGYGGDLKMLVGIDNAGAITGISITESKETPGLGTKATNPNYLSKFIGKTGSVNVQKDGAGDVDAIGSATISSKAVGAGVNTAFEMYELVKGEL